MPHRPGCLDSPQDVFFRTFNLASDRVSLGGFLMLGSNFVELQAFELALDGATPSQADIERFRIDRPILLERAPATSFMV